jgi:hypothetical protein
VLVCNWPYSVRQNHFYVMMLSNRDSAIQKCFQKILNSLQVRKSGSLSVIQTTCHTVRTSICSKLICLDDENFPSRPSLVSRSFELFQLASVRTFQQYVRTTLSVRPSFRISFQNTDMGRLLQLPGQHGFPSGRDHP